MSRGYTPIDGAFLGWICNSFWSDPLTLEHSLSLREMEPGAAIVSIESRNSDYQFQVAAPYEFHGRINNADIEVASDLVLRGVGNDISSTSFLINQSKVKSEHPVTLDAARLRIGGSVWLDCQIDQTGAQLSIESLKGGAYWWGPSLSAKFPFSQNPSTLEGLEQGNQGKLDELLKECARRFNSGVALTLNPDFSAPEADPFTQWTTRPYRDEFPLLMRSLVHHGLAETEIMPVKGTTGRIRVRLKEKMQNIRDGVLNNDSRFAELSADLRAAIPE